MNVRLLAKLLGILSVLIGFFMLLSLVWAFPNLGRHTDARITNSQFEWDGFQALLASCVICWVLGGLLWYYGRNAERKIYRKEAMAVVGLSWVIATLLGAFPYILSGTSRGPAIRVTG